MFTPRREEFSPSDTTAIDSTETSVSYIESPQEAVKRRIIVLQSIYEGEDNWRAVVKGGDSDNYCTKTEIYEIRQRATFLCLAYQLALAHMSQWTWHQCCKEACTTLNNLGMHQATFYTTIAQWNILFRKFEAFPHPNPYVQLGKKPMPPLLENFPDAKDQIISFCIKNLATLTIESCREHIVAKVIPRLVGVWQKEENEAAAAQTVATSSTTAVISNAMNNSNSTATNAIITTDNGSTVLLETNEHVDEEGETTSRVLDKFLRAFGLKTMSFATTYRWMKLLGFSFCDRRKSFYVDGHEREDVVNSRIVFCTTYLTELEPFCNRWVQVSLSRALSIKSIDIEMGHRYFDIIQDEEHIEFHIDYWSRFGEAGITATKSLRVASRARPLMIVGQDESVFAQYLLGSKTWVGNKGQRPLLPKSEGDGYMLSAFVSRDFGFGRQLTDMELESINNARRTKNGGTYTDQHAAMEILGTIVKADLTESPFVKYLFIGVNNEGYWNSFHMSIQFEDVVDCLMVLYPTFDFVFLFDHSQGHARKRDHALSAQQMSKSYGGAQPKMRDTVIMGDDGYLGPHLPQLAVGDTQSMVFTASDAGPWYLSPEQQALQRYDRPTGKTKNVEKSKKLLHEALLERGVTLQQNRGHTKKELQDIARNNGIELYDLKEVITSGWEGQPKGLLQVLGERGLIDREASARYTNDGRKDQITGNVDLRFSLRSILSECKDFKNEETALQYLGTQLGVSVMLTPKFHAELAGEGVEYSWAHAKAYYRRMPIARKRGRESFKQLVRDVTCPVNVLTRERIEKFASRARAYICTYHHLQQAMAAAIACELQDLNAPPRTTPPMQRQLLYTEIERLMRAFKGHRCALDFDRGFVNSQLREARNRKDDERRQ